MKNILIVFVVLGLISCKNGKSREVSSFYDFSFAELALKYFETEDSSYLKEICELEATEHILSHAKRFNYNVPKNSKKELVTHLLAPGRGNKEILEGFKRNLQYAKNHIAKMDLPRKVCLKYFPDSFHCTGKLFFTFGYDLGVAYGNNASLNLAHPYYLKHMEELKYYSIHEYHHAGFIKLKNNIMPSLDISTYKEMAEFVEYLTHLEGMGTYAPLALRRKEKAMGIDRDYVALQDSELMKQYEEEYFDIYFHFKNHPDSLVKEEDWAKVAVLSDKRRLWYRVGAKMAEKIDLHYGRGKLVSLIVKPSVNFINTYLEIADPKY